MRGLTSHRLRSCWPLRFFALAAILAATSGAWLGARRGEAATISALIRAGKVAAQLENVPSHNRRYRASLAPSNEEAEWELRVESSAHEPISGASLVMQASMPEEPRVSEYQPGIIPQGNGLYRVEGLRLRRSGWWNVKLAVTQWGVSDSLAFNVITP